MSNTLITELVCTRLSHDIIGNIGAVSNAVELLEEGDMDYIEDITAILKSSSKILSARLKFFRLAFGLNNANLDDENIVRQTAVEYLQTIGNKDFPIALELNTSTAEGRKNALLMIMLSADILIRGGHIKVVETDGILRSEISGSKIATEKLSKIEQSLFEGKIGQDATLAPLAALTCNGQINLSRLDEQLIFTWSK